MEVVLAPQETAGRQQGLRPTGDLLTLLLFLFSIHKQIEVQWSSAGGGGNLELYFQKS